MNRKFFVITIENENAVKTALKEWWRTNLGPTDQTSHALYFSLLSDGWQSEVIGNEVILISPQANNHEMDEPGALIPVELDESVIPTEPLGNRIDLDGVETFPKISYS